MYKTVFLRIRVSCSWEYAINGKTIACSPSVLGVLTETGPASEVQGPSEPATGGPGPGTSQMGTKTRAFPVPQTRNPGPPETLLCHTFWGLLKKTRSERIYRNRPLGPRWTDSSLVWGWRSYSVTCLGGHLYTNVKPPALQAAPGGDTEIRKRVSQTQATIYLGHKSGRRSPVHLGSQLLTHLKKK